MRSTNRKIGGKKPQRRVDLPEGWWLALNDLCREKWVHLEPGQREPPGIVCRITGISKRTFTTANQHNQMTQQLFADLASRLGYRSGDLLYALGQGTRAATLVTPIPENLSLTTKTENPQQADFGDYLMPESPWVLKCKVSTDSPYFRFGFKLLAEGVRVFGDGSLQSSETANLIVHIGRNDWTRDKLRIDKRDVFFTSYLNGRRLEEQDRNLFRAKPRVIATVELMVDRSYMVLLSVNGEPCFKHVVPPIICRRVVVLAWGDQTEFRVDVSELTATKLVTQTEHVVPNLSKGASALRKRTS